MKISCKNCIANTYVFKPKISHGAIGEYENMIVGIETFHREPFDEIVLEDMDAGDDENNNSKKARPIYIELAEADTPEKAVEFTKKYGALVNPYIYVTGAMNCCGDHHTAAPFMDVYWDCNAILLYGQKKYNDLFQKYIFDYQMYSTFSFYQKELFYLLNIKRNLDKSVMSLDVLEELITLYIGLMSNNDDEVVTLEYDNALEDDFFQTLYANAPLLYFRHKLTNEDFPELDFIARDKLKEGGYSILEFQEDTAKEQIKKMESLQNKSRIQPLEYYETLSFYLFSIKEFIDYTQIQQPTDGKKDGLDPSIPHDFADKLFNKNRLLNLLKEDLVNLFNDTFMQFIVFYVREVKMTMELFLTKEYNYECTFLINAIFLDFFFSCFGPVEIRRCENERCGKLFICVSTRKVKYCCKNCGERVSKRKYAQKRRAKKKEEAQKKKGEEAVQKKDERNNSKEK